MYLTLCFSQTDSKHFINLLPCFENSFFKTPTDISINYMILYVVIKCLWNHFDVNFLINPILFTFSPYDFLLFCTLLKLNYYKISLSLFINPSNLIWFCLAWGRSGVCHWLQRQSNSCWIWECTHLCLADGDWTQSKFSSFFLYVILFTLITWMHVSMK